MSVFMIFTDGAEIDQIVETNAIARREAKDLRKMGCEVRVYEFADWTQAEGFQDSDDILRRRYPKKAEAKRLNI